MADFGLDVRPTRAARVAWQEIEGDTVLLILEEEKLLGLNPVAGRIWQLSDGTRAAHEIASTIVDAFDVPQERGLDETLSFIGLLSARGLLELRAP
jgi:pyrroloquinoline quinone biosynthesis protein D